jgi:hypothetical protein
MIPCCCPGLLSRTEKKKRTDSVHEHVSMLCLQLNQNRTEKQNRFCPDFKNRYTNTIYNKLVHSVHAPIINLVPIDMSFLSAQSTSPSKEFLQFNACVLHSLNGNLQTIPQLPQPHSLQIEGIKSMKHIMFN